MAHGGPIIIMAIANSIGLSLNILITLSDPKSPSRCYYGEPANSSWCMLLSDRSKFSFDPIYLPCLKINTDKHENVEKREREVPYTRCGQKLKLIINQFPCVSSVEYAWRVTEYRGLAENSPPFGNRRRRGAVVARIEPPPPFTASNASKRNYSSAPNFGQVQRWHRIVDFNPQFFSKKKWISDAIVVTRYNISFLKNWSNGNLSKSIQQEVTRHEGQENGEKIDRSRLQYRGPRSRQALRWCSFLRNCLQPWTAWASPMPPHHRRRNLAQKVPLRLRAPHGAACHE